MPEERQSRESREDREGGEERWEKKETQEGESPFRPVGDPDPPEVPPEEDQQPLVEADNQGGVSWEEKRKAMGPAGEGAEGELYDDRGASERQNEDMKNPSWKSPDEPARKPKPW